MNKITELAIKKAKTSICKYKISAIGLNRKFEVIVSKTNRPRFHREGGSLHAEMMVMRKPGVRYIIICRVNNSGQVLPIHPCKVCSAIAERHGVKILTIAPHPCRGKL